MIMKADDWALHAWGRWPREDELLPGGLLDSAGFEIPITGIIDTRRMPRWLKPIDALFGSFWLFRLYRVEFVYAEPRKLSLEEFKKKLCDLLQQERASFAGSGVRYHASRAAVMRATTYKDALFATGHLPSAPPWGRSKKETDGQ